MAKSKNITEVAQAKETATIKNSKSTNKATPLGTATMVISIIFCVLDTILLAAFLGFYGFVLSQVLSQSTVQQEDVIYVATIMIVCGVFLLITLSFGVTATVIISKRTMKNEPLNLALAICSLLFFNTVVGVLAIIYSCLTDKNLKQAKK